MKIPNVDGRYQTKDKRVIIEVTRKEISFEIAENQPVHIIDDNTHEIPETREKPSGRNPLRKMGKGFTDLSYMLIGDGKG